MEGRHDGSLSIFATVFDARVAPDPRAIAWAEDRTDETLLGTGQSINEDWLASAGREVSFYDPQADLTQIGKPKHVNVELLVRSLSGSAGHPDAE